MTRPGIEKVHVKAQEETMSEKTNAIAPRRPPGVELMTKLGMAPDPWQVEVLESHSRRILLNCSRQAGKSTVVAMFSLVEAL
jgi:hypothetical protein